MWMLSTRSFDFVTFTTFCKHLPAQAG